MNLLAVIAWTAKVTPHSSFRWAYPSTVEVTNRTANSFEVHELGGGSASLSFGYRIMALRKNYENVRFADHTHDLDATKKLMQKRAATKGAQPGSDNATEKLMPAPARAALPRPAVAAVSK